MEPLPLLVLGPPGPLRDRLLAQLPGTGVEVLDSPAAFGERGGDGWGILLLAPDLPAEEILELLQGQVARGVQWATLRVSVDGDELKATPVSLGHPLPLARVLEAAADPAGKGPLQELHWVLRVVAKARHDLNNPLTSGLAEAQLLLMDEHPPEVKESLETIQEQFRRLRDMVAELARLRAPRKEVTF